MAPRTSIAVPALTDSKCVGLLVHKRKRKWRLSGPSHCAPCSICQALTSWQLSPSRHRYDSMHRHTSNAPSAQTKYKHEYAGLGLALSTSQSSAPGGDSPEPIDQDFASYFAQARNRPWKESSSNPDLTFGSTLSGTPSIDTPILNSSVSSDSFRKAQSVHIPRGTDLVSRLSSSSDINDFAAASQLRRLRSKTMSEAAFPPAKGRLHKQKRHAIYADAGMQLALSPPEDGQSFPVAVVIPPDEDEVRNKLSSPPDRLRRNGLSISDSKATLYRDELLPRAALHAVDVNTPAATLLDPWFSPARSLPPVPSVPKEHRSPLPVPSAPLKVSKTRINSTVCLPPKRSKTQGSRQSTPCHPIIRALLQDVDQAIKEWQVIGHF